MSRSIDYGNLMHDAMRGLIRKVLQDVSDNGLPGAHHFFITFDTSHPDAELADWLSDRYPGEMTVVMQHWYDNLDVGEEGFAVTLNFGDAPEPLYIPYDAIRTFVDPSVEFGLRFETQQDDEGDEDTSDEASPLPAKLPAARKNDDAVNTVSEDGDDKPGDAEIVSLDSFRK
ncbi:SspB family protein [uncultured Roseobacter sp.]|uniref:SspB family protein n=1 Tax=uncultured Roseobacter sp. TaxID=114847 RepID=UPI00261CE1E7|nr:ClpXP protease specificity-enhancing factor SspB [uncultured Roseobacter sp.]